MRQSSLPLAVLLQQVAGCVPVGGLGAGEPVSFWWFGGTIISAASCALTLVALNAGLHRRLWCRLRRFHEWESELDHESIPHIAKEDLVCRTCKETIDWVEMLEVIKRIPRQSWMDPECAVCDHTNGVKLLATRRNWRPEMTADVLQASFCRRCRKYELRMPRMEVVTDEEHPEPGIRQVHCPTCGRAFGAVGAGPDDEVPQCRRCLPVWSPGPPMRVIRFRRNDG